MLETPWSVTELNQKAKNLLEKEFNFVWVQGEISNLMQPKSGHLYFTIKDNQAQIACVWLKYNHSNNVRKIANGKKWWFKGKISLYQERGNFQLIVSYAEEFGHGEKQLLLEQKKQELKAKGWFEPNHKQPLPKIAQEIAIITSATGAAIQDMIKVIQRRMPATKLVIYPCIVQGSSAAKSIADAIDLANKSTADLLIVGRGGGSIEDLWAYNEDPVIAAIFHSNKPVITGIGHESDHTLSELVADYRAATPSAAAEAATLDKTELTQKLDLYLSILNNKMSDELNHLQIKLKMLANKCISPAQSIQTKHSEIRNIRHRLNNIIIISLKLHNQTLNKNQNQVLSNKPNAKILHANLNHLEQQLNSSIFHNIQQRHQQVMYLCQQLEALNPINLLTKGYAIIWDSNNKIAIKHNSAKIGDTVTIETSDYKYTARILDKI